MTDIYIISGFLGAGKTTFIQNLLKQIPKNEKVVIIENDFGEINFDASLLSQCGYEVKALNSGCICCSIYENFVDEFKKIENYKEVLLIPLGRAVEEVLLKLKDDGIIGENQILIGFPHPSGANVNRVKQLEENKENMISFIKNKF